jgi:hypothetical protein
MGYGVNLQHRNSLKISGQSTQSHHCRTVVHYKCNVTPRPTRRYRQAHCEDRQHRLSLPDGPAPKPADTAADPRTLLPSAPQAKAPARHAIYSLANPSSPNQSSMPQGTDWEQIKDASLGGSFTCYYQYRHHCCQMSSRQTVAFWERNKKNVASSVYLFFFIIRSQREYNQSLS